MSLRSDILKESKRISIQLSFEESKHPRDESGKWTSSGASSVNLNDKSKTNNKKPGINKKKVAVHAAIGATIYGGMNELARRISKNPKFRDILKQSGQHIPNINKKHVAAATAVGAIVGGGSKILSEKSKNDPEFKKKYRRTLLGGAAAYGAIAAYGNYIEKMPNKVSHVMLKDIVKTAELKGIKINREHIKNARIDPKFKNIILDSIKSKMDPRFGLKDLNELARKINVHEKFNNSPLRTRIKISKAIRSKVGVKSFAEHVKHIASKVVQRFRPLKVVKIAGLLK